MGIWDFIKAGLGFGATSNDQRDLGRQIEAAVALLQSADYKEARAILLRVAKYDETRTLAPEVAQWVLNWLWITWEQTEEFRTAIAFYSRFISRHPDNPELYHLRGQANWYEGKVDEALRDYSRVIELDPSDASAFSGRGQVLVERGEFSAAMEDLNHALNSIDKVPAVSDLWKKQLEAYVRNGLGAAHAGLGEFDRADEEFEKSIALCPENAWVYFNRAESYRNRSGQVIARQNYMLALSRKDPKLTPLKRERARQILEKLG